MPSGCQGYQSSPSFFVSIVVTRFIEINIRRSLHCLVNGILNLVNITAIHLIANEVAFLGAESGLPGLHSLIFQKYIHRQWIIKQTIISIDLVNVTTVMFGGVVWFFDLQRSELNCEPEILSLYNEAYKLGAIFNPVSVEDKGGVTRRLLI